VALVGAAAGASRRADLILRWRSRARGDPDRRPHSRRDPERVPRHVRRRLAGKLLFHDSAEQPTSVGRDGVDRRDIREGRRRVANAWLQSPGLPTGTTPSSAIAAGGCRAASVSGSPSPGRESTIRILIARSTRSRARQRVGAAVPAGEVKRNAERTDGPSSSCASTATVKARGTDRRPSTRAGSRASVAARTKTAVDGRHHLQAFCDLQFGPDGVEGRRAEAEGGKAEGRKAGRQGR